MTNEYIYNLSNEIVSEIDKSKSFIPGLVFNYPPISVWSEKPSKEITQPSKLWENSHKYTQNLYIHIPFCKQKCSFCYYSVAVYKNDEEKIWEYLKCLEKEASFYTNEFSKKEINTIFIGGGTPSRLSVEQISYLFKNIIGQYNIDNVEEITFECSADSLTKEKIEAMEQHGVTRISMGVQSFDESVLESTKRDSDKSKIMHAYNLIRNSKVPNINIDLIAGVSLEDKINIERTINTINKMDKKPNQITLFTLSIREGATDHKKYKNEDKLKIYNNSLELYRIARSEFKKLGYWQYSRNLMPSGDWIFKYQDNIWGNNGYVLALGSSGYSHSQHYTYINYFDHNDYMREISLGNSPVQKYYPLSDEESIRRHLVLAMKHNDLDMEKFNSFYGKDVISKYTPIFEAMQQQNLIHINKNKISYTEEGIESVDRYVRLFFSEEVNQKIKKADILKRKSKNDSFRFTI